MKKKIITAFILTVVAGFALAGCGNNKNSANETTSQISTQNHDLTKKSSDDFSGKKIDVDFGDYKIKVPAVWENKDSYYYPVIGLDDDFAMLYVAKNDGEKYDDIDLVLSANEFLEGVTEGIDNPEIITKEKLDINGLTIMHAEVSGITSGINGKTTLYWLINPSDGSFSSLIFFQGNGTEFDYANDVEEIINSIQPITEGKETTTATETKTEEDKTTTENTTKTQSTDIPREYTSALNKAKNYSNLMNMSKRGIYDQLTSEYGENFTSEAAQYAIDNLDVDWNYNALQKAKSYQELMDMSPAAIYDQLVSDYGEKFTSEEAQYAITHLND